MRYKVWHSNKDKELHLLCAEGADAFEAFPTAIRNLGPWTGSKEGEADRLRLPYRSILAEHGFTIVYAHISKLNLEAPSGPPVLRGQAECPDCKGSARWINMVDCVRRRAGVALDAAGSTAQCVLA